MAEYVVRKNDGKTGSMSSVTEIWRTTRLIVFSALGKIAAEDVRHWGG